MSGCSWDSLTPQAKCAHCFLPWSPLNTAVLSEMGFKMSLFFLFFWPHYVACRTSLTGDWTCALCSGSMESQPLGHQGTPFLFEISPLASCSFPSTRDFGEKWTRSLACVYFSCYSSDSFLPLRGSGTHRWEGPGWVQPILKLWPGHQDCPDSGFLEFGSWSCYPTGRSGVPSFMPKRGQWAPELATSRH